MINHVESTLEPFMRRGLFSSPELAVMEMAREYVLHQIDHYRFVIDGLQAKHGMPYEQFEAYLKSRSVLLAANPSPELNQAIIAEEEDALDWKIARDMLQRWLGLQVEVGAA